MLIVLIAKKDEDEMNGLTLNLVEAQFNKEKISIYFSSYSDELWQQCQIDFSDYSFYRFKGSIYAWKLRETKELLKESFKETVLEVADNPQIFARILEASVVGWFANNNYEVENVRHSSVWTVRLKGKSSKVIGFQGLNLAPFLEMSIHSFFSKISNKPVVGISLRKRYKPEFIYNSEDFIKHSIDIRDWVKDRDGKIIPIRENIEKYLKASGQEARFYTTNKDLYSDLNAYTDLVGLHKSILQIKDKLHLPDDLKISEFLLNHIPNAHFSSEAIRKPTYYYYNERTKNGAYYNVALEELSPTSYDTFSNKSTKIVILAPQEHEGSAGSFSKRLEEKMKRIFHMSNLKIEVMPFDSDTGLISKIDSTNFSGVDLAVIFVSEKDKLFEVKSSPYFLSKAKLLNQQIPSQDVTIEKIKLQDLFIENNIALNIYSKIGGVGWTIQKDIKDKNEIIVGIGTTVDWEKKRRIGFANVFDYNGTYIVGDCSQISTMEDYSKNLEGHITKSIQEIINTKGIEKTTPFRLIFHLKKEAGYKTEIFAVENALRKFPDYQIQYALLHISYNHNLRLYNNEGKFKVDRGTFLQLSQDEALLHLGGTSVAPILIRVDFRSTYTDIFALSQQVLFFSHLSQRSFRPANEPVTTKYPTIMAKLTSDLSQISNWDMAQLDKLREKLWFI